MKNKKIRDAYFKRVRIGRASEDALTFVSSLNLATNTAAAQAKYYHAGWNDHKNRERKVKTEALDHAMCPNCKYIFPLEEPKKAKQTRHMTREEVILFLWGKRDSVKIRLDNYPWRDWAHYSFNSSIDGYRWATISLNGNIGEPQKFEVEA